MARRLDEMERTSKAGRHQVCRACLESSEKLYPLVGTIINVDVNIATMISYCISNELNLHEDLPNGVCIPCFKMIRIAYNFLRQFKESQEKLLKEQNCKEEVDEHLNELVWDGTEEDTELNEENIAESVNEYNDNLDTNEANLIRYDLETIHNYAERRDSPNTTDMLFESVNQHSFNLQTIVNDSSESETEEYSSSVIEYVEDTDKLDDASEDTEVVTNPSLEVVKELLIWDESVSESMSTENNSITKSELVQKDVHSSSGCEFTCPVCNLTLQRMQKFNDHVVSHDIDMIICNKCSIPVELNIFQYIQHYKELHRYQCNICNRSLTSSYGFRYHMKQHENVRKYICPIKHCKKSFFLLHLLKKHMRTHSNTIKYSCNLCGANFRTYDTYRYHQKTHGGKRNHLCTECGKAFFQAVHLRDHMFRHNGYKHFTCDMCGTSFTTNSQLKKHLKHCRKFRDK